MKNQVPLKIGYVFFKEKSRKNKTFYIIELFVNENDENIALTWNDNRIDERN